MGNYGFGIIDISYRNQYLVSSKSLSTCRLRYWSLELILRGGRKFRNCQTVSSTFAGRPGGRMLIPESSDDIGIDPCHHILIRVAVPANTLPSSFYSPALIISQLPGLSESIGRPPPAARCVWILQHGAGARSLDDWLVPTLTLRLNRSIALTIISHPGLGFPRVILHDSPRVCEL
jgi:hypothetical protein